MLTRSAVYIYDEKQLIIPKKMQLKWTHTHYHIVYSEAFESEIEAP